jgi:hypothetical protein
MNSENTQKLNICEITFLANFRLVFQKMLFIFAASNFNTWQKAKL